MRKLLYNYSLLKQKGHVIFSLLLFLICLIGIFKTYEYYSIDEKSNDNAIFSLSVMGCIASLFYLIRKLPILIKSWKKWTPEKTHKAKILVIEAFRHWFPLLIVLHGILFIVIFFVLLFIWLLELIFSNGSGFAISIVFGGIAIFTLPMIAFKVIDNLGKKFNSLPHELTFENGGWYVLFLGLSACFAIIISSHIVADWQHINNAQKLPNATISEAIIHHNKNILLGLKDGKIKVSGFGYTYHRVYNRTSKRYNGSSYYVVRMESKSNPQQCLYIGQSTADTVFSKQSLRNLLNTHSNFYQTPYFLSSEGIRDGYNKAIKNGQKNSSTSCNPIVLVAINDNNEIASLQLFLLLALLLPQLIPLLLLVVYSMSKLEKTLMY